MKKYTKIPICPNEWMTPVDKAISKLTWWSRIYGLVYLKHLIRLLQEAADIIILCLWVWLDLIGTWAMYHNKQRAKRKAAQQITKYIEEKYK